MRPWIPVSVRILIASAVRDRCGKTAAVCCASLLLHSVNFPAVRHSEGLARRFPDYAYLQKERCSGLNLPSPKVPTQDRYLILEDKPLKSDQRGFLSLHLPPQVHDGDYVYLHTRYVVAFNTRSASWLILPNQICRLMLGCSTSHPRSKTYWDIHP